MLKRKKTSPRTLAKADRHWIRTRKNFLDRAKNQVAMRLGAQAPDLRDYTRRYELEFKGKWKISSKTQLLSTVEMADIVYGGDFHALSQSQRVHLRILRGLSPDRPLILALECFSRNSQKWLDAFSAGEISADDLRSKSKWDKTWGFPWENYLPLLNLALARGYRLLALGDGQRKEQTDLKAREAAAAKILSSTLRSFPGALIYVIFGDLHLAKDHLPLMVREARGSGAIIDVVIHLNSERIYFQLAQKGLELTTDVVDLGRGRFCVMGSPPWVQWQSYMLYLDRSADVNLDHDDDDDVFDPTDQVAQFVQLAASDIGLEIKKVDDLSVYSSEDDRIWNALENQLKSRERETIGPLLSAGRVIFLPQGGIGYLGHPTVNQAAALAGQYLHARLSKRSRTIWNMPGDFQALIWVESVAYFFSKLINHKRQADSLADLRAQLEMASPSDHGQEAMKLALDQALSDLILMRQGRRRPLLVRPRRKSSYIEAARVLGGMLGERLYLAFRSRKLEARTIVRWLKIDVTDRNFNQHYAEIIRGIGESRIKSKRERL